jgi:GNAT superfamily N-acetyltransferase
MKTKIVNLTEENLRDAPEWETHPFSCKYCIWWEFPERCIDPAKEKKEEVIQKKLKWLRDTNRLFGNCGKILYVNDKGVGYSQYAPPKFLPHSADYQAGPPSKDAVLISCLFIPPREFRGLGLGSQLLQSIISDLRARRINAVETFARKSKTDNPSGPMEFYLRNGFGIYKDDKEFPLMRLEL